MDKPVIESLVEQQHAQLKEFQRIAKVVFALVESENPDWGAVYSYVFRTLNPPLQKIRSFGWYDPDTSCEEDVRAYARGLEVQSQIVGNILSALEKAL